MEAMSIQNNKGINKPNEDFILYDEAIGCAILLDGVSRDKENGVYPNPSPALEVSELFANSYLKKARALANRGTEVTETLIKSIIKEINEEILLYNQALNHSFPAGTVGIVMHILNDRVLYAYIGDCNGGIISNGIFETFTQKQTELVAKNKKSLTTKEIRYEICNNIQHPYGYGVIDGNSGALDFVVSGEISVKYGDIILLYTDGAEPAMEEHCLEDWMTKNIEALIGTKSIATGAERPNSDDQSLIRIFIQK